MSKQYKVGVMGATGAVGTVMLNVLEERNFPISELRPLASHRSAGKKLKFKGEDVTVQEMKSDSFQGLDIVLASAGGSISKQFVEDVKASGAVMIDNTSAFRMDKDVPLVVPEVNPEDAFLHKGVIANPNCTTIIMLVALKPLHDAAKIKRIVVSTYQAVSGSGVAAMKELEQQAKQYAAGEAITVEAYPHQIAFNVLPHVDVFQDNGYTREEMKMVNETRKMFHDDSIQVSATCVRVPVFTSHAESIQIETERKISADLAREILSKAPGVQLVDDPAKLKYPMPLDTSGQDDVWVGRIREDLSHPHGLALWVSGDQLRKGAATNAVQIAELLIKEKVK
jgi:aspartate-semialdehyde dehydrogenase